MSERDPRRRLPSVQRVVEALDPSASSALRTRVARAAIDTAREQVAQGASIDDDTVFAAAAEALERECLRLLGPVVNATGILLHTNLGRAPLADALVDAMSAAAGAVNLELELATGQRGGRHEHAAHALALACGAQAGLVVNNNAAAVVLCLAAHARGRDVIVSRGELVEIGGGFRVPEIMAETGARLVEVGTTNRTRVRDYETAMGDETALLLKVHASNYRMVGFVEDTSVAELAALGPPVMVDAGSGLLDSTTPWLDAPPSWLRDEPGVRQCLAQGASLVTFSGDKLLGGPQAGIIVGDADAIERCRRHPLARALRADKLTLAALQALAFAYLDADLDRLAVWKMATTPLDELRRRSEAIAQVVTGAKVVDTEAAAGGGSLPGLTIPSVGVAIAVDDLDEATALLRAARVVVRVDSGAIVCDLRSVRPAEDAHLTTALQSLVA